jgi:AraC family transcriptional regulator of adaptative response / DNA-3-methyladenine glycosylase II
VEQLAERLGLGSRQLRRLCVQHLGVSPVKIATTQRVHLATKLIDESKLPMTEIAFHSGFKSIREFNHAFRTSVGQSPSQLRLAKGASRAIALQRGLELRLPYRTPFDWQSLLAFLEQRAIPRIELVSGNVYQRTIEIDGARGFFSAQPDETESRLRVHLELSSYEAMPQAVERIRRIFDLGADPARIARHLSRDPKLRASVQLHPGLRVPGVWDGFEAAVLAILGQTLGAPGPKKMMARFVRIFGSPIKTPVHGLDLLFPTPEALAASDLSKVGIAQGCALRLRKLTRPTVWKHLKFAIDTTLDETVSQLNTVTGIDESSAHYIVMRAFGEPDAFPLEGVASWETERWRPWRAYAAMHIEQGGQG